MKSCTFEQDVERLVDGELEDPRPIEEHVSACLSCAAYLTYLRAGRAGIETVSEPRVISDAQLPVFLDGIRERVHSRRLPYDGIWALMSAAAAAIVVSVSLLAVFSGGPKPVEAKTIVESLSTDINGATATSYYSEDGTATVWVNVPEGDMW